MSNSLKSWMILNNATADIPVAGETGAHDFDTTLLAPYYDNGTAKVPWRFNFSLPMVSPTGTAYSYTGTSAYEPAIANSSLLMDMTRFREARLTLWGCIGIGTSYCYVKVVDTTNSQDVTNALNVSETSAARHTNAAWKSLNSATYGSTQCELELQVLEGVSDDVLKIYSAQLSLR